MTPRSTFWANRLHIYSLAALASATASMASAAVNFEITNSDSSDDCYDYNDLNVDRSQSTKDVKNRLSTMGRSPYGPQKLHRKK